MLTLVLSSAHGAILGRRGFHDLNNTARDASTQKIFARIFSRMMRARERSCEGLHERARYSFNTACHPGRSANRGEPGPIDESSCCVK